MYRRSLMKIFSVFALFFAFGMLLFLSSMNLAYAEDVTENVKGIEKYAKEGTDTNIVFRHSITRQSSESSYGGILLVDWTLSGYGEPKNITGTVPIEPNGKVACPVGATLDYLNRFDSPTTSPKLRTGLKEINEYCYAPFKTEFTIKNSNTSCNSMNYICLGQKKEGYRTENGKNKKLSDSYCQSLTISGTRITSGGTTQGQNTISSIGCTNIYRPYNYSLVPKITGISSGIAFGGDVTVTATFTNEKDKGIADKSSQTSSPSDTELYLYAVKVPQNVSSADLTFSEQILAGDKNINEVKSIIEKSLGGEIKISNSSSGPIKAGEEKTLTSRKITLSESDYPVGTKICFVAVTNYTKSSENTNAGYLDYGSATNELKPNKLWQISPATCTMVSKTVASRFEVRNGSVFSDGGITAAYVKTGEKLYGSWVDYGVISNSAIENVASGKSLMGGTEKNSISDSFFQKMTISNTDPIGNANIAHSSVRDKITYRYTKPTTLAQATKITSASVTLDDPNSYTKFSSTEFTTIAAASDADKNRYTYLGGNASIGVSTNYELGSTEIGTSVTHVVYSEGDIHISSNLKYFDGPYVSAFKLPQYIIIAKGNIYIDSNVSRVDAWLIASEKIYSCSEQGGIPCDSNQLTINGPVMAKSVELNRTYGKNNGTLPAAEIIVSNAASFYWANTQAESFTRAISTYVRELAPRK